MVKIQGSLHSDSASGTIGPRITFSMRKTGAQARYQKAQKDAKSFEQLRNREVYFDAVGLWRKMTEAEKKPYNDEAKGRSLTGFNLFIQEYYMNTIRKLATVKNIDFTQIGTTPFYQVPTGTKLVVLGFVIRVKNVEGLVGDGIAQLVQRSVSVLFFGAGTDALEEPDYSYFKNADYIDAEFGPVIPASDWVDFNIGTGDSGNILVCDVDLIGYLIEA